MHSAFRNTAKKNEILSINDLRTQDKKYFTKLSDKSLEKESIILVRTSIRRRISYLAFGVPCMDS